MASRREETSDSEEESSLSLSDNENLAPPNKKRRGRKAQWRDCHVADMVDVICSNDNFSRKLIFTNSKNTRNNEVYVQVLKEVEKRYTGSSSFPFSTGQMRTKFKRCVAECKKLALGSLRYRHYGLRTTVIHGEDLVRDLLRMLHSTWVSQSVVWLQATGSSRGDSRSKDYVSIFLPIFDQF